MTDLQDSMKMLRAACAAGAMLAGSAASTAALAADLPTTKEPLPVLARSMTSSRFTSSSARSMS